ncbi:hypothetical protein GO495_31070 [Chitinophaga oryziterrae]|uniref:Uncharacterized protein n=1 Tax=Chitinophaga oryziterrae TaxID=1031224 RepID=A0A6N8JIM2_9BACT|nr:hypothetical protein [Chitinophaga oryziterrae]MVT45070.1 hypothetical protein [Chitinophaga oryziterrae]
MNIEIFEVTNAEFDLIRPHFEVNAKALANQTQFVGKDGELIPKPAKEWFWGGYDQSKFLKAVIDEETYIIGAGNIITGVISEVLPEACQKYPNSFGTRNAHSVIEAIFETRPELGYSDMTTYEQHLSTEQFAMVFKLEKDGSVNHNVLRLDLFRMIKEEKDNPGKYEFIGGLMHLLKHFKFEGHSLSTNIGENELVHPNQVIGMIIKCFFESTHIYEEGKKSFTTVTSWSNNKEIICSFYPEQDIEVYFLNTMYLK